MKKLNNKGFTLVELLAVLVILIAIMSIAIPSISSSLERSKDKQNEAKIKILESAAELYVTDHKNKIIEYMVENSYDYCTIGIKTLKDGGYIDADAASDSKGNDFTGCIKYTKNNSIFIFGNDCSQEFEEN